MDAESGAAGDPSGLPAGWDGRNFHATMDQLRDNRLISRVHRDLRVTGGRIFIIDYFPGERRGRCPGHAPRARR